jgi:hypothetical protein
MDIEVEGGPIQPEAPGDVRHLGGVIGERRHDQAQDR